MGSTEALTVRPISVCISNRKNKWNCTPIILDTGSGISVIGGIFFDKYLREKVQILPVLSTVSAANAQQMTVRGDCELEVWIGMLREKTKSLITKNMCDDV